MFFAALTIVSAPVILLFIVLQRQFIAGLSSGAIRGQAGLNLEQDLEFINRGSIAKTTFERSYL